MQMQVLTCEDNPGTKQLVIPRPRVWVAGQLLLALFLSGCAASLVPGYEREPVIYRWHSQMPWRINVASQWRVWAECGPLFHGCTNPETREVWAIDSLAVVTHECRHVRALEEGATEIAEWAKDLTYGWVIDNTFFILTAPLPAPEKPCGDDYVYGSDPNSRWTMLRRAEEVRPAETAFVSVR
jgi:hypothetical protein